MGTRVKNFRRRAHVNDDYNNNNNDDDSPPFNLTKQPSKSPISTTATTKSSFTSTATATAAKPKKHTNQPPKFLSFADDEENSKIPSRQTSTSSRYTKLSSSSLSHNITSTKDQIASSYGSSLTSNVQPQAGTYTKQALLELQKITKTLASSRPAGSKTPSEPVIVMKGLIRPVDTGSNAVRGVDELGVEEKGESLNRRNMDDAQTLMARMGIGKSRDESRSLIPDQTTINAIRAKREKLRHSGAAAPDLISVDGGSNHGSAEGLSDEEPEFRGRIAMFMDKESVKKGVFEDVDLSGIDSRFRNKVEDVYDEKDEEGKIWEEEQFGKGLGRKSENGSCMVVTSSNATASIGGSFGASHGFDEISISQRAEIARKSMQENVRRLKHKATFIEELEEHMQKIHEEGYLRKKSR